MICSILTCHACALFFCWLLCIFQVSSQQRRVNPIKSWQQLFTGSTSVAPDLDTNVSSCKIGNGQIDAQSSHIINQRLLTKYVSEDSIGQPLPSNASTTFCEPSTSCSFPSILSESLFPSAKDPGTRSTVEEAEIFEDPCYVPDPTTLLGPVSEALDNFPLDLGAGFLSGDKLEEPQVLKNISAPGNIAKPSPIESPISRFRSLEEKKTTFGQAPCTLKSLDSNTLNLDESQGSWQLWGTPAQDSLGLVGGPSNWFLPIGKKNFGQEDKLRPIPHKYIMSQIAKESPTLPGIQSQHVYGTNQPEGVTHRPHCVSMHDSNMQKLPLKSLSEHGEIHFLPSNLIDNMQQNDTICNTSKRSTTDSPFELSPANCWFK